MGDIVSHNPQYNVEDARRAGYEDIIQRRGDHAIELPCLCPECVHAYYDGQERAMAELYPMFFGTA